MFDSEKEATRVTSEFSEHIVAWLKAIGRIPLLGKLPDSEEEIAKWMDDHPDDADLLDRTLTNVTQEFSLHISPSQEE